MPALLITTATVMSLRDGMRGAGIGNKTISIAENFLKPEQIVPTRNQETISIFGIPGEKNSRKLLWGNYRSD